MKEHVFFDDNVEYCKNCSSFGNQDVYEIGLKEGSIDIHKDDVIHLAKLFGLIVFNRDSEL